MNPQTCARIHLDHLRFNFREIRKKIAPARLIPVVKADAYGHGAVPVSRCLVDEGSDMMAVAQFREAMELRDSGIGVPILIFGRLFPEEIPEAIQAGFRITLFGVEDIRWIERAPGTQAAHVHVNVETGMGRVGVQPEREPDFFETLSHSRRCVWEGLYSHFATSDEADKRYAHEQLARFNLLADTEEKKDFVGLPVPAAAVTLVAYVIFSYYLFDELRYGQVLISMIILFAFLMVSQVEYLYMPENFSTRGNRIKLGVLLLAAVAAIFQPRLLLFPIFACYILFGMVREFYRLFSKGVGRVVTGRPHRRRKTDRE